VKDGTGLLSTTRVLTFPELPAEPELLPESVQAVTPSAMTAVIAAVLSRVLVVRLMERTLLVAVWAEGDVW
jgi:hypothetical protein